MRIRIYIPLLLILLFWQAGCRKNKNDVLPSHQQRFVEVYVELQKFKQRHTNLEPILIDSSRVILKKFGFTKQEYERSLAYLNEKPERWEIFYKQVLDRLQNTNVPSQSPSKTSSESYD